MDLIFETMHGLEDVAAAEVDDLVGVLPRQIAPGRMVASVPSAAPLLVPLAQGLRCSDRFGRLLTDARVGSLDEAKAAAAAVRVERHLESARTFGVRATRAGQHTFKSQELGGAVGAGLLQRLRDRGAELPAVDLDEPELVLRADLFDDQLLLWVDAVGDRDLSWRAYREYAHMASMRPINANLLLRLAGWTRDTNLSELQLIDPFCGSATILIEAMLIAAESAQPPAPGDAAHGIERFSGHVRGAVGNVGRAGLTNRVQIHAGLAEEMDALLPARSANDQRRRIVVTNPPFGRRVANPRQVDELYGTAAASWVRADVRRVVTLAMRETSMAAALEQSGFEIQRASAATYGATPVTVFLATR